MLLLSMPNESPTVSVSVIGRPKMARKLPESELKLARLASP